MLQLFALESCGLHQNAQRLTGNTKNWQMLNIVIKILCLVAGKANYFKSIDTADIFTALHGIQRGLNDEISVCPSVRPSVCPSVCQTRAL